MANLQAPQYADPRQDLDIRSYISGYFDGEGCFCVSISPRSKLRVGWEVRPSVSVSQNGDRGQVIRLIAEYFGCGSIRPDRSDQTIKWESRRLDDLIERVLPHFERWPLLSGKQADVEILTRICALMKLGQHHTKGGLELIAEWSASMNPSGSRRYSVAQIRGEVKA